MATGWYVVEPPTTGLLDAVKGNPARALMVGQNTYSGSLTASIKAALVNFQGGQFVSGVATMLADPASASMNGVFANRGDLTATTKKVSAAMAGTFENRATLASVIAKATASLNGSQIATGALAATAAKVSAVMNAPIVLSSELLSNIGFESGFSSWYAAAGVFLDSSVAYQGVNSARLDASSTNPTPFMAQGRASCNTGDYKISFFYKNDAVATGRLRMRLSYKPLAGGAIKYLQSNGFWSTVAADAVFLPYAANWTYFEYNFQLPEDAAATAGEGLNPSFLTAKGSDPDFSVWLDNVSLKKFVSGSQGEMPVTLQPVSASLAGNLVHSGILSGMLKPIGASMAGYQNPQGTLVATAAKATAQLNGGQDIPATFAAALAKAQALITSEQGQAGVGSMAAKAATFGATSVNPPTFNSAGASASGSNGSTSSLTANETHVLAAGTRRYAVAAMTYRADAQNPDPTNQVTNRVQWGGVDMTLLGWVQVNSTTGLALYGYAIPDANPAGNVTVAFRTGKAANTGRSVSGLSVVYNGSSGVLLDAYAKNGVGATPLVMASTTNEIALGTFGAVNSLTGVAGTGQRVRGNTNGGGGFTAVSLIDAPGDTSVSFAATGAKACYGVRVLA